jgi:hypothetical protein
MVEISEKELDWLILGDENDQIVDKLTNKYDDNLKLKTFLKSLSSSQKSFTKILVNILKILNNKKDEDAAQIALILKNMNQDQIKRLYILDEKYNLVEMVENEKQRIYNAKLNVIKSLLILESNKNYSLPQAILKDYDISNQKISYLYKCHVELQKIGYNMGLDEIKEIAVKYLIDNYKGE